ncbi:Smr/MutS family protein [Myxococcus sp. K15C18031901]|uniref:Smr/MutS family protein n=1 Tax=Myxococcus dinghuensis TaxID=2906761 RepID=UPI0020A7975B|nr:Smr/MutS family protein [Myxococcus dinghuensis]MCP3101255.1 Smr/MutS family protein [Myxococcus dinghuensis]
MSQHRKPPPKKEETFHNNPFKSAIKSIQDTEKKQKAEEEKAKAAATEAARRKAAPPAPSKKQKAAQESAEEEASLFFSAMDGVAQLTHRGEPPRTDPRLPDFIDENAEALAQLSELVAGSGDFDISGTDEFLEGASPGIDRNLLRSLRRGDFSVQARLDLHGMTQVQAREAVERFLSESRRAKKRCVLIVHGRGLHSKDQLPVLKEGLKSWLSHKRVAGMVLAFATARPQDGGAGAVYVLLRR